MEDLELLMSLCRGRTVYIQTHNFPDPDAIGSAFGLQRLLLGEGIESILCYAGSIDKLSTAKMVTSLGIQIFPYQALEMTAEDIIICVDSQKGAGNITDFIGSEIACIDHHPTFVPMEYKYKDIRIVGACATLIAGYYEALGKTPDAAAATAMLYGLKMDTLQFTRGVTVQDIRAFEFLFPLCDAEKLAVLEHNKMEFHDLKAYGAAIENVRVYGVVGIASISFACPDALVATISDFLLSLQEVEVAVVYSYREDGIKFSVRSEDPDVHAGQLVHDVLAELGNGGGHAFMAGGLISKSNMALLGNFPEDTIRARFLERLGLTGEEAGV